MCIWITVLCTWNFTILYIKYTHPRTTKRSNQSILKEGNPEYSLEGLMLKLKLQYLATWCEELTHWKRLMQRKTECKRRRRQRMRWLDSITNSMDMNLSKLWEVVENRGDWCATVHEVAKNWTWLSDRAMTRLQLKKKKKKEWNSQAEYFF